MSDLATEPRGEESPSLALISARLQAWDRHALDRGPTGRRAAVVIVLVDRPSATHVLVVKRSTLGRNAGQWALPGGRMEPLEDAATAALRELHEEIDVTCTPAHVLGQLDDVTTRSGFVITPVVVAAPSGTSWRRNPTEVASVHPIPLHRLTAPGTPRWRATREGTLLQMPLRHDMVVHAPTGAILWQFAEVCLHGRPRRLEGIINPAFTAI